jgi:hypothetical protein
MTPDADPMSLDWYDFDLSCDGCGARLHVTVRREVGRVRMESYNCPECRNSFFCQGSGTPSVRLLASGVDRQLVKARCSS